MTKITISYRGQAPSTAKGLPVTLDVDEKITVEQVKRVLATKFPKARHVPFLFSKMIY